jgi:hypothetical protein
MPGNPFKPGSVCLSPSASRPDGGLFKQAPIAGNYSAPTGKAVYPWLSKSKVYSMVYRFMESFRGHRQSVKQYCRPFIRAVPLHLYPELKLTKKLDFSRTFYRLLPGFGYHFKLDETHFHDFGLTCSMVFVCFPIVDRAV